MSNIETALVFFGDVCVDRRKGPKQEVAHTRYLDEGLLFGEVKKVFH